MTEIDDEMVERAGTAYASALFFDKKWSRAAMREALTAALTPPKPEPEIEVTAAMKESGGNIFNSAAGDHHMSPWGRGWAERIYRAMESTRLKEAQERNPFGVRLYWDKNDRRQNGRVVAVDRRIGDRRGRDRFVAQSGAAYAAKDARQEWNKRDGHLPGDTAQPFDPVQFWGMTRD